MDYQALAESSLAGRTLSRAQCRQVLGCPGQELLKLLDAAYAVRREHFGDRAVFPFQPPPRRIPLRPFAWTVDRQQTGDAFDHHRANLVLGLADQRDARTSVGERHLAHPFGPGARLARAASAEDQPGFPVGAAGRAHRGLLMIVGECLKVIMDAGKITPSQSRQRPALP